MPAATAGPQISSRSRESMLQKIDHGRARLAKNDACHALCNGLQEGSQHKKLCSPCNKNAGTTSMTYDNGRPAQLCLRMSPTRCARKQWNFGVDYF